MFFFWFFIVIREKNENETRNQKLRIPDLNLQK